MQVFQQSDTAASRALQPFYAIINVIVVVVVVVGIFCPAPGRARPQLPLLGLASSAHLCQLAHCCVSLPPPSSLSCCLCLCCCCCCQGILLVCGKCLRNCNVDIRIFRSLVGQAGTRGGRQVRGGCLGCAWARPLSPVFIPPVICASCAAWGQCKSTIQVHLLATS